MKLSGLKKSFRIKTTIEPFYTGGRVVVTPPTYIPPSSTSTPSTSEDDVETIETIDEIEQIEKKQQQQYLVTPCGNQVHVMGIEDGRTAYRLQTKSETLTCVAASPLGDYLIGANQNLLIQKWDLKTGQEVSSFKAHEAPVLAMDIHPTGALLATGSADSTVKVWDLSGSFCTHNFKGHSGIVSCVKFHTLTTTTSSISSSSSTTTKKNNNTRFLLFSGGDDGAIRVWDLKKKTCIAVLNNHVSVVRSLDFTPDGAYLISAGRDKVVNKWDLSTFELVKTMTVFESIEGAGVVPLFTNETDEDDEEGGEGEKLIVFTGGEKGILKLWDLETEEPLTSTPASVSGHQEDGSLDVISFTDILFDKLHHRFFVFTMDQNILVYDYKYRQNQHRLVRRKQFVGYNEEIIDFAFVGTDQSLLAVASNSEQIRIYDLATHSAQILSPHTSTSNSTSTSTFDSTTTAGHTSTVLCLDASSNGLTLVSGSKDNKACVWRAFPTTIEHEQAESRDDDDEGKGGMDVEFKCVGVCVGHTEAVGAIGIGPKTGRVFVTGSQDRTVKVWDISNV
ncbi:Transducin (beta)-like 3, partial [Quaeritorhiza haematococci]